MPRGSVTIYTTTWCGYCVRLKQQLDRAGVAYNEIDIETDPTAADTVMRINGGNSTVPTVVYPDGSSATNPSVSMVLARLSEVEGTG